MTEKRAPYVTTKNDHAPPTIQIKLTGKPDSVTGVIERLVDLYTVLEMGGQNPAMLLGKITQTIILADD